MGLTTVNLIYQAGVLAISAAQLYVSCSFCGVSSAFVFNRLLSAGAFFSTFSSWWEGVVLPSVHLSEVGSLPIQSGFSLFLLYLLFCISSTCERWWADYNSAKQNITARLLLVLRHYVFWVVSLSVQFWCMWYLRNALREFLQIWLKYPLVWIRLQKHSVLHFMTFPWTTKTQSRLFFSNLQNSLQSCRRLFTILFTGWFVLLMKLIVDFMCKNSRALFTAKYS